MQTLSTKLSIPPVRSKPVARLRLIQRLNQGLDYGMILVSAPAGYGKSTLLSLWLNQAGYHTAWLSLDDRDNDLARFLGYLKATLRVIDSSIGEFVDSTRSVHPNLEIETLLTPLINQLAQKEYPIFLVLDDYHVIQDQAVHQAVSFLLEHRPRALHLVIATRADPPLPLARLRARSAMLELRQADLCFTAQETSDFLNDTMGLQISSQDVARVTARTEGWVAGLQMAALSMQNSDNIPDFIAAFTGSHYSIFDYLMEEILGKQAPEIRRFLLDTCILDQLTAPLCDALLVGNAGPSSGRSASVILTELDHANLFIVPLDHERRWYRYHSLFLELLRGELQRNDPTQIPALHARASAWFEERGLIPDAIHHALAASEWERVVRLISANVFALLELNELQTVARQIESMASGTGRARPWLGIARAWLAAYTGQLASVESILNTAESEINCLTDHDEQQTLRGHCAAIQAFTAWIGGERGIAAEAAREALECLDAEDHMIRCQSATVLGLSQDDMDARALAFEQALVYAGQGNVSHVTIFAHGCRAYLLVMQGRLREALVACREAMRLAKSNDAHQPLPTLSYVYSTMSLVLWEWNDLDGALKHAREAVALALRWEQADALHFAYTNLGSALFALGDVEGAFEILHQAWQVAHRTSAWFEEITVAQEIEWYLAEDNREAALQRLRRARVDLEEPSGPFLSSALFMASAQIFLAQKQYSKALAVIAPILEDLEKKKVLYFLVRTLTWQALAYQGLEQDKQALASLRRALILAAPEGYVRSFFVGGETFVSLLHQARAAGIAPDHVDKLLAAVGCDETAPLSREGASSELVESLSRREMDVMRRLAQGCSDKQIAEALVVSPETIHKHLKNIYGKLGVHNRTEAVVHARELGLL